MQRNMKYILGLVAYLLATAAFAQSSDVTSGVMTQFQAAAKSINTKLVTPALGTACAAVMLQWILSHWKDLFNGELSNSLAKIVGLLTWFGATVALINNMALMTDTFTRYLGLAGSLSNLSASEFSPGALIDNGVKMINATNVAFSKASGEHWYQFGQNILGALMLVFANIFTFLCFLVIALTLFVAQLEFWIIFSVAPLAFGLIPLSAFRDQGFAPIKGVISLGLRLLILGVVVAVSKSLTDTVIGLLNGPGLTDGMTEGGVMTPIWYYLAGVAGCAMMALSAGKIASSIASGSASFSGSDAVRGGMQLVGTAAAGAAVAVAGKAALAGAASKLPSANDAGRAVGTMGQMLGGKPSLGVSPTSGQSGGQSSTPSGLGGSPVQERPSAPNLADSSPSPAPASPSGSPETAPAPAGDASTAGIGGGTSGQSGGRAPTAWEKAKTQIGKSVEQNAQENHAVGVQMHVGKE